MLTTFGVRKHANDKMGLREREFGLSKLETLAIYKVHDEGRAATGERESTYATLSPSNSPST